MTVVAVALVSSSFSLTSGWVGVVIFIFFPLACLASAVLTPSQRFREIGKSKALWVILPFLFGPLAAAYYFLFVHSRLRRT